VQWLGVRSTVDHMDEAVEQARGAGLSWARIGEEAGMSAQGAHERWTKKRAGGRGPAALPRLKRQVKLVSDRAGR
jgi:hypothetical protein